MSIKKDGKSKDGETRYRVRVDYYDKKGKRNQRERIVYGKRDAQLMERRMMEEIEKHPEEACDMTVKELCADYLRNTRNDGRETTSDKKAKNLEQQVIPYLGNTKLRSLTTPMCREWKNTISDKGYAITTLKNLYNTFNSVLNYAVKQDYLRKNPLSVLGTFRDVNFEDTEMQPLHYYTKEQFEAFSAVLLAEAQEKDDDLAWGIYVFFMIAFFMGMRKGEINALRWSDIKGSTIHVCRSVSQKLKGEDRITPPKNKSSVRNIDMPSQLIEVLQKHKKRWMTFTAFSDEFFVCGGPRSLRDTTIEKANIRAAEKAGLPHIRIHDFRHSHASLLCNAGVNIQEIARRLGHANVQETWRTYSHMYPSEESKAIQILESSSSASV